MQPLHCRSVVSPHCPDGHEPIHVEELRKFGLVQPVHVVAEPEQVVQGEVQLLQVLSLVSPQDPGWQGLMHVWEFRKSGLAQLVQFVAAPEQVRQRGLQVLQNLSAESPYSLISQLATHILVEFFLQKLFFFNNILILIINT